MNIIVSVGSTITKVHITHGDITFAKEYQKRVSEHRTLVFEFLELPTVKKEIIGYYGYVLQFISARSVYFSRFDKEYTYRLIIQENYKDDPHATVRIVTDDPCKRLTLACPIVTIITTSSTCTASIKCSVEYGRYMVYKLEINRCPSHKDEDILYHFLCDSAVGALIGSLSLYTIYRIDSEVNEAIDKSGIMWSSYALLTQQMTKGLS